jgi:phage terminase small subunit
MPRAATPAAARNHKAKAPSRTVALRQTALNTSNMDDCRQVDPHKPLTDKQKAFVTALASGESPPNALLVAGMSDSNPAYAYRLMAMPNIQLALSKERQDLRDRTLMTRESVVAMHMEAFELAKLMAEPASMVAAAREIGKMHGFYEPKKVEITLNGQGQGKRFEQMSTSELEEMVAAAQKAEQDSRSIEDASSKEDSR